MTLIRNAHRREVGPDLTLLEGLPSGRPCTRSFSRNAARHSPYPLRNRSQLAHQKEEEAQDIFRLTATSTRARIKSPTPEFEPEFDRAVAYLNTIKAQFADQPDVYKCFLDILHESRAIDLADLHARVEHLFHGHPGLIQEFNAFFPPIGCAIDSDQQDNQVIFPTVSPPDQTTTTQSAPTRPSPSGQTTTEVRPSPSNIDIALQDTCVNGSIEGDVNSHNSICNSCVHNTITSGDSVHLYSMTAVGASAAVAYNTYQHQRTLARMENTFNSLLARSPTVYKTIEYTGTLALLTLGLRAYSSSRSRAVRGG